MRIIGERREPVPGLRWPSEAEIRRTVEFSRGIVYVHRKGVVRFRNHEEADRQMEQLKADAMARRHMGMARR